jgi:hypothetical protein
LLNLVRLQRLYGSYGQAKRAPRLLGFHIAVRPNRPPYGHVRRDWWIGIRVTVQVHVIPAQSAGLLGPAASQEAEHDAGVLLEFAVRDLEPEVFRQVPFARQTVRAADTIGAGSPVTLSIRM